MGIYSLELYQNPLYNCYIFLIFRHLRVLRNVGLEHQKNSHPSKDQGIQRTCKKFRIWKVLEQKYFKLAPIKTGSYELSKEIGIKYGNMFICWFLYYKQELDVF